MYLLSVPKSRLISNNMKKLLQPDKFEKISLYQDFAFVAFLKGKPQQTVDFSFGSRKLNQNFLYGPLQSEVGTLSVIAL